MAEVKQIRLNGKKIQLMLVLTAWLCSILACSQGYISQSDMAATSSAQSPVPSQLPSQTASPTAEATATLELTPTLEISATPTRRLTPTVDPLATPKPPILYYTQAGDTLASIMGRFGVLESEIKTNESLPAQGLIKPDQLLIIPDRLGETTSGTMVMPDSEVVFSPSAAGFDVIRFIESTNGFLKNYNQQMSSGNKTGAEIVQLVALENSINPYLLLSILEYKSHWVYGQPTNMAEAEYPMGYVNYDYRGLYQQLSWTVQQLSIGYYGWRAGILSELMYTDGTWVRMDPRINAGTAAVQYLFAQWFDKFEWADALYGNNSMPKLMEQMFGSYLERAQAVEPLYPPDLQQPTLELPFVPGKVWSFTGGPHSAWGPDGALAAVDFAPPSMESGCVTSNEWVTAMAPGVIVRSENGLVMEDLDFDGIEQTGWNIMYLHIATQDRIEVGTRVETGGKIGHPSCEGGNATGTHTHVARKYNGEWILAGGPMPFNLSGYIAQNGPAAYLGTFTNASMVVTADTLSSKKSFISRSSQ